MCGRYYVDDETARMILRLARQMEEEPKQEGLGEAGGSLAGDICPGEEALVLSGKDGTLCCRRQRWGFPWQQGQPLASGGKLIFNARSESVLEKPLFRDGVLQRRVVIPAAGFYEWNHRKEKYAFYQKGMPTLFMAGFSRRYEDGEHFVILTTAANSSVAPVHERMPLILDREELTMWIEDRDRTEEILRKVPCLLERKTDYEQMSLF